LGIPAHTAYNRYNAELLYPGHGKTDNQVHSS